MGRPLRALHHLQASKNENTLRHTFQMPRGGESKTPLWWQLQGRSAPSKSRNPGLRPHERPNNWRDNSPNHKSQTICGAITLVTANTTHWEDAKKSLLVTALPLRLFKSQKPQPSKLRTFVLKPGAEGLPSPFLPPTGLLMHALLASL